MNLSDFTLTGEEDPEEHKKRVGEIAEALGKMHKDKTYCICDEIKKMIKPGGVQICVSCGIIHVRRQNR